MNQSPPPPQPVEPMYQRPPDSNRIAAGILGIFLGGFGIHKFVLGYTTAGIIMLVCSLTCIGYPIMHIIGLVEGILYLTKSDEEFYNTYVLHRHEWF